MHVWPIFLPTTLLFVILASFWLEFAFQLKVLRDPVRLLKTPALSTPLFILWDAYVIANSHWVVNPELTTGIFGPLGIPFEEYLSPDSFTEFPQLFFPTTLTTCRNDAAFWDMAGFKLIAVDNKSLTQSLTKKSVN